MARRLFAAVIAAAAFTVVTTMAASTATLVFKDGQRQAGTLVYDHDTNVSLIINGAKKTFPFDDVAVVEFVAGNPTAAEIGHLSPDAVPTEHNRHMLTLRDGTAIRGKLYDIKDDNILFDTNDGTGGAVERKTFAIAQVARLYMSAPASRDLFGNITAAPPPVAQPASPTTPVQGNTGATGRRGTRGQTGQNGQTGQTGQTGQQGGDVIQVAANRVWTDSGIDVRRGDRISFVASGTAHVAPTADCGPDGYGNRPAGDDRSGYPIPEVPIGALIGRIGNSTPFVIGANTQAITMPTTGRLMLGINDNNVRDNGGGFSVRVR
jgi:hypothetical protein